MALETLMYRPNKDLSVTKQGSTVYHGHPAELYDWEFNISVAESAICDAEDVDHDKERRKLMSIKHRSCAPSRTVDLRLPSDLRCGTWSVSARMPFSIITASSTPVKGKGAQRETETCKDSSSLERQRSKYAIFCRQI